MSRQTSESIWVTWYEELRTNALSGPKRKSFEFFLMETVHPVGEKKEDVKDMIDTSVEFFAIAEKLELQEAKRIFHENLRYIAGYYDELVCKTWREILSEYE